MKLGIRMPSIKKSISAKLSPKRIVKNALHLNLPDGVGAIVHPKKAIYNKVYNKTSFSIFDIFKKLFKK
jgi:hypothetical protein